MRTETIGDAVLYCGDCLDILPTLDKVDCVITDPPYSPKTHKGAKTNKRQYVDGGSRGAQTPGGIDLITFDSFSADEFVAFAGACLAVASRWVVMTCDFRHAPLVFDWAEFIRLGVWVKIGPMPQISGDRPGQGHENILILHPTGKKRWNKGGKAAVWRHGVHNAGGGVPTQKPIALIEDFVSDFTDAGETVCDPCMGSGTTGSACAHQGRKFVGIEANGERFDIACERIDMAQRQQRLFA